MAAERHLDLQLKTIVSLVRENETLQAQLCKSKENSQKHAERILREALDIMDEAKTLDLRGKKNKLFPSIFLFQVPSALPSQKDETGDTKSDFARMIVIHCCYVK